MITSFFKPKPAQPADAAASASDVVVEAPIKRQKADEAESSTPIEPIGTSKGAHTRLSHAEKKCATLSPCHIIDAPDFFILLCGRPPPHHR